MFKKLNKKGFTLAELLVVVAIIGVLVAISIPIFTSQLEKANQATDAANIRAAYAEAAAGALMNDGAETSTSTTQVMKSDSWNKMESDFNIAGISANSISKAKGQKMQVTVNGTSILFSAVSK